MPPGQAGRLIQCLGVGMANCEYCGKSLVNKKRSDARFCNATCRAYFSRNKKRAEKRRLEAEARFRQFELSIQGKAMVEKLSQYLPETAKRLSTFIEENGASCAEAAVKLCLLAYIEAEKKLTA